MHKQTLLLHIARNHVDLTHIFHIQINCMQLYNACLQAHREGTAITMATSTVQDTDTTALGPSPQAGDASTPAGSVVTAAQNTLSLRYAYSPTPLSWCVCMLIRE